MITKNFCLLSFTFFLFLPTLGGLPLTFASQEVTAPAESIVEPILHRVNFQIEPLAVMYGIFGAEVQIGVLKAFTLGTRFNLFRDDTITGSRARSDLEFGLNGTYNFSGSRFKPGVVFEAGFFFLDTISEPITNPLSARPEFFTYGRRLVSTLSYLWAWPNSFNLQLGFGGSFDLAPLTGTTNFLEPIVVWKLGFAI